MTLDKPSGPQILRIIKPLKKGAKLKHYITSSSKQFTCKTKKPNLKYLLNFMSLNCAKYQQKNLKYLKVLYLINHWWTIEQKSF